MKFKKIFGYLFVSTMILSALAPTGSVLASEMDNESAIHKEQAQENPVSEKQVPAFEEVVEDPTSATLFQDSNGEWQQLSPLYMQTSATRITVTTQTLSVSQVKQVAKNIKTLNGSGTKSIYSLLGTVFGPAYDPLVTAGLTASAGSQARSVIRSAMARGKRVKIAITDNKDYHISYSMQFNYTIVN